MAGQKKPAQDFDITDPVHWKGFLAVGGIGLLISLGVGKIFGIEPIDVLLLREPALGIFQIGDYAFIVIGLVLLVRRLANRK